MKTPRLVPLTCLLCDELCEGPMPICLGCEHDLPWRGPHCEVCAKPLSHDGLICGACLSLAPRFYKTIAPWHYRLPIDSLITRFKHQGQWQYGKFLALLLARHLEHLYGQSLAKPDCLIAVPLTTKRLRQRGFNQAQMLCDWLGQHLAIKVLGDVVVRSKETLSQQQLTAKARKANLSRAFSLKHNLVKNAHVAVVDDVLTTGATAQAMAKVLYQAGAKRIDIYCLARTPAPGEL